jgi:Spy/CpxP family protein refolding chaperone
MGGSPFGHIRLSTKGISHAPTAQLRRQGCFERRRVEEANMNRLLILLLITFSPAALAQSQQPYAGLEARSIKAMSEQQIADLRAGRGMGLALAAELNGYPGPMHVLEMADALHLSDQQRAKMRELFTAMKAEAIPLGERLITQEAELDKAFAGKTITTATLAVSTEAIGATNAALRQAHLKYHLLAVDALTQAQIQQYAELRGYKGGMQHPHRQH